MIDNTLRKDVRFIVEDVTASSVSLVTLCLSISVVCYVNHYLVAQRSRHSDGRATT